MLGQCLKLLHSLLPVAQAGKISTFDRVATTGFLGSGLEHDFCGSHTHSQSPD